MGLDPTGIRVEPGDYTWYNPERTCVTTVDSVPNSSFFTMDASDGDGFYVWFNVNSGGVDPAPSGRTGIEVAVATGSSASATASAIATAVDGNADFASVVLPTDNTIVVIENIGIPGASASVGATADGSAATGFTFEQAYASSVLQLGFIDGAVEFGATEQILDVTAQQFGTQVVDGIRTGVEIPPLSVPMKEVTVARLREIVLLGGGTVTPSGGTEVYGYGESKRYGNVLPDTRRLLIHPRRLASTNRVEDLTMWRAYPVFTGLNFSGEEQQLLNVEFRFFPDQFIDTNVNFFFFGDWQQNLLAA